MSSSNRLSKRKAALSKTIRTVMSALDPNIPITTPEPTLDPKDTNARVLAALDLIGERLSELEDRVSVLRLRRSAEGAKERGETGKID